VHLPPGVILAAGQPQADPIKPQVLPPSQLPPVPPPVPAQGQIINQVPPHVLHKPPPQQYAQPQEPEPIAGPSRTQIQASSHHHDLRPHTDINYKQLHTSIKKRCQKLRRSAKAFITKLALGTLSLNQPPRIHLRTKTPQGAYLNLRNLLVMLPLTIAFFR